MRISDWSSDVFSSDLVSGIVVELAGEVGDLIPIGSTLAVIETDGEGEVEAPPADTPVEQEIVAETPGAEEVSVAEVAPTPESVRSELVAAPSRSEWLRVGKEWDCQGRSRWGPDTKK